MARIYARALQQVEAAEDGSAPPRALPGACPPELDDLVGAAHRGPSGFVLKLAVG